MAAPRVRAAPLAAAVAIEAAGLAHVLVVQPRAKTAAGQEPAAATVLHRTGCRTGCSADNKPPSGRLPSCHRKHQTVDQMGHSLLLMSCRHP